MNLPDATVTVVPELNLRRVARDTRRIAIAYWHMAEELDPLVLHAFRDGSDGELECSECGDGPEGLQHFERVAVR